MTGVDQAIRQIAQAFGRAGIDTPLLDARLLMQAAAELDHADIIRDPDREIQPDESARLDTMIARRLEREPVSRILGYREFRGLDFQISGDVLDPRPDSELLVETALAALSARRIETARILDLGTGSGCLLISLLAALEEARGIGVDISMEALGCARRNAGRLGVAERASFVRGSWLSAVSGTFDLLIANPPYISSRDMGQLQPEVALYDPALALDGGERGLDPYPMIMHGAARVLAPGGLVFFEIGAGQAQDVINILRHGGVADPVIFRDLAGLDRVVGGQFTGNSP